MLWGHSGQHVSRRSTLQDHDSQETGQQIHNNVSELEPPSIKVAEMVFEQFP
jgi:hypothetical protein